MSGGEDPPGRRRPGNTTLSGVVLGGGAFLSVLAFPVAGAEPSFNIDFASLAQILRADFRHAAPCHDVVKFHFFLFRAGRILPDAVGGNTKRGDALTAPRLPQFRIASHVSNDLSAIE